MLPSLPTMPFLHSIRDTVVHEDAPDSIISLSWAFLIIPCIFLAGVFIWIAVNFSQPSEFPEEEGLTANGVHEEEDDDIENDEKDQLLDPSHSNQSHSAVSNTANKPQSSWKINSKYSSTLRGGSVYSSYPDPSGSYSPSSPVKAKRSSLLTEGKHAKTVGSKAAKVLTLNKDRMLQDLERLDPIDREELQRSSSRASSIRKSD